MEIQKTIYNFSAGPCCLPNEVLRKANSEFMNWNDTGISMLEVSHRSKLFEEVMLKAESNMRKLLSIPDNFKVLFLQGGATMQFSSVCMNLLKDNKKCNYLETGFWSKAAYAESLKFGEPHMVIPQEEVNYSKVPDFSLWDIADDAAYFHICDNETVNGVELNDMPFDQLLDQTIVADMSSNFCSRPIDWNKYGVVYAGAQKNVGPCGLTFVIVREDLIGNAMSYTPSVCDWSQYVKSSIQIFNTPCIWSIYVSGLNLEYMAEKGIEKIEEESRQKSNLLYDYIDSTDGYYINTVDKSCRSRTNIPIRIKNDADLESKFIVEAEERDFLQLNGHKLVGGVRVSLYNAMPIEGVEALVAFMKRFREANN